MDDCESIQVPNPVGKADQVRGKFYPQVATWTHSPPADRSANEGRGRWKGTAWDHL